MFFKRKSESIIELQVDSIIGDDDIKIVKNGIEFGITVRQTFEKRNQTNEYVWLLFVRVPRKNKTQLIAFSGQSFITHTVCQQNALTYVNDLPYEFYKKIKEVK